jgi:hypothetical protein
MIGREVPVGTQSHEMVQATTDAAAELFRSKGMTTAMDHIHDVSRDILDPQLNREFEADTLFATGSQLVWREDLGARNPLEMLWRVPFSRSKANDMANLGKDLAADEKFIHRGRAVLGRAAEMFDREYQLLLDDSLHIKPAVDERATLLLDGYFRVASLQDEAGDQVGAKKTTEAISPHLIQLAGDLEAESASQGDLDDELSLAVHYLGSLDSKEAQQLFMAIEDQEHKKQVVSQLIETFAGDLLQVDQPEAAVATLAGNSQEPLNIWLDARKLQLADGGETVQRFIDGIDTAFPDYFKGSDTVVAAFMTPMVDVLAAAGRANLLEDTFKSYVQRGGDFSLLVRFAQYCGSNAPHLKYFLSGIDLDYQQRDQLITAYEIGESQHLGSSRAL